MLGALIKCIRSSSSIHAIAPLICVARAALGTSRSYKSAGGGATAYTCSLPALMNRGVMVSVLDFEISAAEAVSRFEDYQRKACMYLHAHSLLRPSLGRTERAASHTTSGQASGGAPGAATSGPGPSSSMNTLTAAYLPYWCFDVTFNSEAYAKLGFKDDRTRETVWKDMTDPLTISTGAVAPFSDHCMQVYASYKYVRDVGGGAAGQGLPLRARELTRGEAEAGFVGGVTLHPAGMRQGLAWQLALRALTHQQLAVAEGAVKAATRATDLRDVRVALQVAKRACRLVFLPAYIAVYQYGTRYKQGTSGVIVPQVFTAVIGGAEDGRVVAPEHLSPAKASLSTGGLVGALGLFAGDMTSWAAPFLGLETLMPQVGAVEALTLAALAASGAGLWTHQRPQTLRAHHAAKQVRADFEFYKKYDIHETYGSGGAASTATADGRPTDEPAAARSGGGHEDYVLWLWVDADWRRWEQDEPWNWVEEERRSWAEGLWRQQASRRLERERYVERRAAEAQRRAAEEEAEARRERMYGGSARSSSSSSHRPRDHGLGGGDEGEDSHVSFGRRRRRSDFLGYYQVLGLQDAEAVSTEDIKQAFKAQALLLHPDKHVGADVDTQRVALIKFQKLQIAYDTLRDAEKRRLYDRGQLVQ